MSTTTTSLPARAEALPPPTERYTVLGWLHKNLFSTWYNALLTVIFGVVVILLLRSALEWALTQARWEVITANLRLFMVGQYPAAATWRAWACVVLLALLIGLSWGIWGRNQRAGAITFGALPFLLAILAHGEARVALLIVGVAGAIGFALSRWRSAQLQRITILGWVIYFPLVILLISGLGSADGPLSLVTTNLWGGLLLTLLLTVVGIVFSFPLGVLLALGRQSSLPIVRALCVIYIEVIRGVPLITVLFMAQLMLPLFLPGVTIDRVVRAMAGIVLFSAAYLAENVRGGLQAIPRGQYEAARALGLNTWKMMLLIILPQALKAVIPILVGQFIALFKDTSLVVIVGLLDLMGIAKAVLAQPDFLGLQAEVYLFVALVYGVFCYLMSAFSQRLEARLNAAR
ncbi:MAG: amino acid ABC transporter permease [Chloroflexi bacterium]|jgi:general L-amino acid transport system permease protein|uniref:Amino acid ABC transporter permease n=1 Tax=Candidatus Thermofonsia Clade 3 bacterium TaxID=2364212 RepID=A0A2M8QGG1_9CHLR|nr:amino acid ABC transporter permease [Candidatus Roseilinea sp. NK_OTU-006]PJF48879.1 MAG: amino acid ABC transporter permease [Candidatus Thermofonsia Clade 3 bacterium]RMG66041.1 MAG: amino acid ABC transporter permease [Chloroflexota bacterium]